MSIGEFLFGKRAHTEVLFNPEKGRSVDEMLSMGIPARIPKAPILDVFGARDRQFRYRRGPTIEVEMKVDRHFIPNIEHATDDIQSLHEDNIQ